MDSPVLAPAAFCMQDGEPSSIASRRDEQLSARTKLTAAKSRIAGVKSSSLHMLLLFLKL